jgi:NAD kinase
MTPAASAAVRTQYEKIVIVTRPSPLDELVARFNTVGQAKFYLEHAGQEFAPIERRHRRHRSVLDEVRKLVPTGMQHQVIDRSFLPQFSFGEADLVVTVGPDGLVVNTAKYLNGQAILAINPDPEQIEGVLLPFDIDDAPRALAAVMDGEARVQRITMAEVALNDGQRLLAFNDLFVGVRSHVSARYRISHGDRSEDHSSSGILISTGAGSTGWLRSVYAGAARVAQAIGAGAKPSSGSGRFAWDAEQLVYVVREPWPSKTTGASIVYGTITRDRPLVVASQMADNGVIFSDGIEADFLAFTAGLTATINISDKTASLVMPS